MINVCFGLHDADGRYSKFVGTTMASIFENTAAPVTIHILHDATLTADNRDKFSYLAGRYGQHVNFHNVEELCPNEISFLREKLADKINLRFSIGTFYRLLIKKIFGGGKMIYLDADIIVNLDIVELWRQDLKNFPLAAVPEIDATFNQMITNKFLLHAGAVRVEDYFCSGVIMFNLDRIGENFFYDGVQFLADNPACESPDQDILNAFFSKNYLKLEQKFDAFALAVQNIGRPLTNEIYHYAGHFFGLDTGNPYYNLWLEHFVRTPWFNLDALYRIAEEFRNVEDDLIRQMQWLIVVSDNRHRAFFSTLNNLQVIGTLLSLRDDDRFIELRRVSDELLPASMNELVAHMQAERGQTIFFIFDLNYPYIAAKLASLGFKEYEDFVNGLSFLTRAQRGTKYPEYNFIHAL